jgi:adenylate cyclase
MLYWFGEFTLDTENALLCRAGAPVGTEPQVIGLLAYLVEHRERIVSKDELIEAVWDGRIVSDATLNSRINSVRRALGDSGKSQSAIRTFSKRGYQFVARIEADGMPAVSAEKPTVAVLPFDNLSGDPAEDYFADGITEDIITGLSAFHALQVIARNSAFAFRRRAESALEIGEALNAGYLVEGSVRRSGNQVRITARLVDAARGTEIWSQRYDREFKRIFEIQDEVTESVVAVLPDRLQAADLARAKRKHTENMLAYDYVLRGIDHHYKVTPEDNARAIAYLEKAIEIDPGYAQAFAWLACTLGQGKSQGYYPEDIDPKATELIERARELDANDSEVYRILAAICTNKGEHKEAGINLERASALNPNDPKILNQRCESLIWQGRPDEGLMWLDAAKRRDPIMGERWWRLLGRAKFELMEYEPAFEALSRVQGFRFIDRACLAASLGYAGRTAEAETVAGKIVEADPGFTVGGFVEAQPFLLDSSRQHLADGLRKAGLPSG